MNRIKNALSFYLLSALLLLFSFTAPAQTPYQKPPKVVQDILNASTMPQVSISPTRENMLLVEIPAYPSIDGLSEPMLRLAGLRINPNTNGPHRSKHIIGLTLKSIVNGKELKIRVPPNAQLGSLEWSPNGRHFAFTNTIANGMELWVGDATTGHIRRIPKVTLNGAYAEPVKWMPDSRTLVCPAIVDGRGNPPLRSRVPLGPKIQESYGKQAPIRTYQDLLQDSHDEALFEYYATSQIVLIDSVSAGVTSVGKPAIISSIQPSSDGRHLLVVTNHKPYSYLLTVSAFPKEVEVWDLKGQVEYKLASLPLAESVPIDGVPMGPRNYHWRPSEPATLIWVEAMDEGDPKKKVPHRDRVLMLKAPFQGNPGEIAKTEHRFGGLTWGEKAGLAIITEFDRARMRTRAHLINVDERLKQPQLIWDRLLRDRYNDPGEPVMRVLPNGQSVMLQHGNHIYLKGEGASPKGDRPFLARYDLTTLKSEKLFQCDDQSYESIIVILKDDATSFITCYETPEAPPNYFIRSADGSKRALTKFPDPTPQLRGIKKQLVTYLRDDGQKLSFTLFLPPDYREGTRLSTVLWAYPLEFTDADTAGQVSGSTNRFTVISGYSHLFFALLGYAVLDGATMPVVGDDPETVNNTYVEQIVASAQAAINKAVDLGVTDRDRVGVGGHSYGAFMTANLLAHSDLFKAGIARSGAYNRTLTPFGFQSERRSLWEATEMYLKVSPFLLAHKIKEPVLLIHGEADNNTGTFPIQSERMYQAIKGNGGYVRYVTLPYESHGYAARESVEHVLWEMINWFDKHVKQGQPTASR